MSNPSLSKVQQSADGAAAEVIARSDCCSSWAVFIVEIPGKQPGSSLGQLLLCRHHFRQHNDRLAQLGAVVTDVEVGVTFLAG